MKSQDHSAKAIHGSEPMARRKPRPRKLSKIGHERRQELIEATIRTIGVNGYDAVTVASICEEAGFSRGLIGHYFSGKDELLLESVRTVAYRLGSAIRESSQKAGRDLKNGCMPLSEQVSQPRVLPPIMSLYGPLWLALHVGHHSSLVCIRRYGEITAMESAVFLKAPLRSVVS